MGIRAIGIPPLLLPLSPLYLSPSSLNRNPIPLPPSSLFRLRHFRCSCRRGSGQFWDSNAENVQTGRFKFRDRGVEEEDGGFWNKEKRKWWSDDLSDGLDEESELFDDVVEDLWDKIWIFKVFKSYGYLLPFIIASMLLATGPKAFLMALALPLGQSALSLAIEKVWGKVREGPRAKSKNKPFVKSGNGFKRREGKERPTTANQGRQGYQSWAATDLGRADRRSDQSKSSFGGWDELDGHRGSTEEPGRPKPSRTTTRASLQQDQPLKKGKLTRRGKRTDAPLFLRLLVAVFPFLSSWTRIL